MEAYEKAIMQGNNKTVTIRHSQVPIEHSHLLNAPATNHDDTKKYTFDKNGKIMKIESFDEEHRLSKEKLFTEFGKQEITRNYEYLKNTKYTQGYITRITEYNLLTGTKIIKEISPSGNLISLTETEQCPTETSLNDSGNLKILSDNL